MMWQAQKYKLCIVVFVHSARRRCHTHLAHDCRTSLGPPYSAHSRPRHWEIPARGICTLCARRTAAWKCSGETGSDADSPWRQTCRHRLVRTSQHRSGGVCKHSRRSSWSSPSGVSGLASRWCSSCRGRRIEGRWRTEGCRSVVPTYDATASHLTVTPGSPSRALWPRCGSWVHLQILPQEHSMRGWYFLCVLGCKRPGHNQVIKHGTLKHSSKMLEVTVKQML